jgi:hypothetical protein
MPFLDCLIEVWGTPPDPSPGCPASLKPDASHDRV